MTGFSVSAPDQHSHVSLVYAISSQCRTLSLSFSRQRKQEPVRHTTVVKATNPVFLNVPAAKTATYRLSSVSYTP